MSSESNINCSFEGSDSAPVLMVKQELQDGIVQDLALNTNLSPAARRSRRKPVLSSKLRDMDVSLLILRNTLTAAPESEHKLSKNRNRKSSCQAASPKELSTLGIATEEIIVKIEPAEEEDDALANFVGEAVFDGAVDLSTEMLAFVHPCVTKVELVETNGASLNNAVLNTAGETRMDGQSDRFLSVNNDAVTCLPAANLNTQSQLASSIRVLPHSGACTSKGEETPLTTASHGLECLKGTWFNHPAVPLVTSSKRNCYYCRIVHHAVARTRVQCKTCKNHLCLNKTRNCFVLYHYGTLQPSFPPDRTLQTSLSLDRTSQPSFPQDGTLQPSFPPDGTLQPSFPPDGTLQPSFSLERTLQPSFPQDGTLQPSFPPDGTLQPSFPPDGTLQPSFPPDGTLQPSFPPEGTLQPYPPDLSSHIPLDGLAGKIPGAKPPTALTGGLTFPRPGEDIISFTRLNHPPIPVIKSLKKNCLFCYRLEKKVRRSKIMCQICGGYYCLNKQRNCLVLHHDGRI